MSEILSKPREFKNVKKIEYDYNSKGGKSVREWIKGQYGHVIEKQAYDKAIEVLKLAHSEAHFLGLGEITIPVESLLKELGELDE